ncbi:hypothetical protein SCALM49S_04762 [Streptomyces californicus]
MRHAPGRAAHYAVEQRALAPLQALSELTTAPRPGRLPNWTWSESCSIRSRPRLLSAWVSAYGVGAAARSARRAGKPGPESLTSIRHFSPSR